MAVLEGNRRNIVVLGAGFGGLSALLKLHRGLKSRGLLGDYQLVLVNKNAQHLYTPALYEIASIPRGEADAVCLKSSICIQVEDVIARFPEIRFIGEEVTGLDPAARRIYLRSGNELPFEYALVALGAEVNFFNIPGLAEGAYPLKTFADAVRLRNRVEELQRRNPGALRIVIGGAGATGVELAAELVNFLGHLKGQRAPGNRQENITLVEAAPEILSGFSPQIVRRARRRLTRLGVNIAAGSRIARVDDGAVRLTDGRLFPYHLLVWAGGIRPAAVLRNFGLALDPRGGIAVNEFLEACPSGRQAGPRVYAVGDCAGFVNPKTGQPLPQNVPVAEAEARRAARNIIAEITGQERQPFRPLARYPYILAIGGAYAISDLLIVRFSGLAGWCAKQLVELRYLLFVLPWGKAFTMWLRAVYYSTRND